MRGMGSRARVGWLVATVVVSLMVAAAPVGAVAASSPGPSAKPGASGGAAGTWQVRSMGGDQYAVSWTSPTRFPMTSDRPTIVGLGEAVTSAPTVAADGRTVRVLTTAPQRPDPADLDVVLSGVVLDRAGGAQRQSAGTGRTALDLPGTETLPVDPGTPGPYDVVTSDYELDPVPVARMREPIEMVGHVVEPAPDAATGPRPLVLFLHGRHNVCYNPKDPDDWGGDDWPCRSPYREIPSQLGYDYIQQVLASQGYATVSIRVNGINAQDYRLADGGADARAQIVEAHLDHWVDLAAAHQVDLDRVVLVGHSRGGEGVNRASLEIPLSAPYRIAGQVLIAPTDFATQTAPYVPTVTLLPFCDGDVSDLEGQRFTDSNRDLADDDTSFKSTVMVMGANHNYFNTEWTPGIAVAPANDDWWGNPRAACGEENPDRLDPAQQQAVGLAYVAGAVHLFADGHQDVLPMFDGSRARVESQGVAQTLSHAIGGGRDVRRPRLDTSLSLADGAQTRFCTGTAAVEQMGSCARAIRYAYTVPHWRVDYEKSPTRPELEMTWTAPGQSGGLLLDQPLDLSADRLELRTIVDPRSTDVDLRVRITDADGHSALLTPVGGGALPALGTTRAVMKFWAQTLEVDPAVATGVDLARITRVDLVSQSAQGRLWVLDLAAAPARLAAVPDRRAPTIDLATATIDEGDGRGTQIARLPFQVVGDLDRPARIVVVTVNDEYRDAQRFAVDLAPGQTSGSIPISYEADRSDDPARRVTQVAAWATRNVMTDQYLGSLAIRDDDPSPKARLDTVTSRVDEGKSAVWRVRLDRPVDYNLAVRLRVVNGPGTDLRVSDVPARWVRRHGVAIEGDRPLWRYHLSVWAFLRPGRGSVDVAIPTRADSRAEGTETLTLRLKQSGRTQTRTIRVVSP